jgi:hypothetical protein
LVNVAKALAARTGLLALDNAKSIPSYFSEVTE